MSELEGQSATKGGEVTGRRLMFTTGSPFARAIRVLLHELELDYEPLNEIATPTVEARAAATPTLQVPTLWDGDMRLWESGLIAEYLLSTYRSRPPADPPLAAEPWRAAHGWHDRLVFATIQTFGTAATTISQLTWTGVAVSDNAHLELSAARMAHVLDWLEEQLPDDQSGFLPGFVSMQDIFLAAHIRFVEARPLGIDLRIGDHPKLKALGDRLDARDSFRAIPIWWWEPGVTGYASDGTPIFSDATVGTTP